MKRSSSKTDQFQKMYRTRNHSLNMDGEQSLHQLNTSIIDKVATELLLSETSENQPDSSIRWSTSLINQTEQEHANTSILFRQLACEQTFK